MKISGTGHFVLKSGKVLDLSPGNLSIDDKGRLCSGFDDCLWNTEILTQEERVEIAAFMSNRWLAWMTEGCQP